MSDDIVELRKPPRLPLVESTTFEGVPREVHLPEMDKVRHRLVCDGPARVLNLGAGVQSTTLALLAVHGYIPRPHCAVFADTGWEPAEVYRHLGWLGGVLDEVGIPLFRVSAGDLRDDALRSQVAGEATGGSRWASLPYFTLSPSGSQGMIRRQCTSEYKIAPIDRFVRRAVLGLAPRERAPKALSVENWLGISWYELQRQKSQTEPWRSFRHPLCGDPSPSTGPDKWRRFDCLEWLGEHYPGRTVPRSACVGCPFHSDAEWRHLKESSPAEFEEACRFDEAIRDCAGMRGKIFLHRSRMPLREVDFSDDQLGLWGDECAGVCGV